MKRTFEGKAKIVCSNGIPTILTPDLELGDMIGKEIHVRVEVELVTLKDRIEKIFDNIGCRPINTPITAANYCDLFFILRERVLAELDET